MVVHISALTQSKRLIAGSIWICYLFAELHSENATLGLHVTTIKQFYVTIT